MRALQRLPEVVELLTFVTAVDERSIRRAAARLHVSPAAVAKRLDNLEAVVGKPLLVRSPRGLVPTLDGTDFYNRAVDVLDSTAALVGDRRDEAAETLRRVRKVLGRQVPRPTHAILVDTERLLANTLDILSEGVAILGPDDVLLEANDAFSEVVGVDRAALVGRRIDGLEASRWADRERGQAQIDAGAGPLPVEYDARRVEVSTREIVLVRIRDLTVEERLELHLRRQERFPALGRLLASAPTETMVDATLAALRDELRLDSAHLLETDEAGRPTSGPQRLKSVVARLAAARGDRRLVVDTDGGALTIAFWPGTSDVVFVGRRKRDDGEGLEDDDVVFLRSMAALLATAYAEAA